MNHTTKGIVVIGASMACNQVEKHMQDTISVYDMFNLDDKKELSEKIYSDFIESIEEEFDIMRINSAVGGDDFTVQDIQGFRPEQTLSSDRESKLIIEYGIEIEHNDSDEDFAFDDIPTTVTLSAIHKMIRERVSNHLHQHLEAPSITHDGKENPLTVTHIGVNIVNT